jgi:Zn-dependent protease
MLENLQNFLFFFPVFLFSLSFHEASHAWTANQLGDGTAKFLGRITLNPLAHIDWIGTVIFPFLMFMMPGFLFLGWAKPVPVNDRNLRGGRTGSLKVSLAGPAANIILAGLFGLALRAMPHLPLQGDTFDIVLRLLVTGVLVNVSLAIFNLLPIPPLDGSHVLELFLPYRYLATYHRIFQGPAGFIILILLLYSGVISGLVGGPIRLFTRLIIPGWVGW